MTHENQHVQINSNGQLLDKKNADRILTTWLGEVSFSLDAATPETYRKIRGADFGRVVENVRYLIAERRRLGRARPHVSMNMTLMRENIEETVRFVELAHELGAEQVQLGHMNQLEDGRDWRVEREGWVFELFLDWAKPVFYDAVAATPELTARASSGPGGPSRGVCKFVNGRPSREDQAFWSRRRLAGFLKGSLRSAAGESAWGKLQKLRAGARRLRSSS